MVVFWLSWPIICARCFVVNEFYQIAASRKLARDIADEFIEKAPKEVETLESGFDDATAVLALPEYYRKNCVQPTPSKG